MRVNKIILVPSLATRLSASYRWPNIGIYAAKARQCPKCDSLAAGVIASCSKMKLKELTRRQLSTVRCPTCGVPAGKRCVLHSDGLRSEPHINRKFAVIEMYELRVKAN